MEKYNNQDLMKSLNKLNYMFFRILEEKDQSDDILKMKEQFIEDLTNYLGMINLNDELSIYGINCLINDDEMDTVRFKRDEYASVYETFLNKDQSYSCAMFDESFYARIRNARNLGNVHFFHKTYVYNENQITDVLKIEGPFFIKNLYLYQKSIEKILNKSGYERYEDIGEDKYTGGTYKNSSVDKMVNAPFYDLLDNNSYDGINQSIQVPRGLHDITYQECINKSKDFNKKCLALYPLIVEAFKRFKKEKIKIK